MPHVLFIVPDAYPPAPAVGCLRVAKFLKFLPQFGFSSTVLTTKAHGRMADDAERAVYRTFDPEPWALALARFGRPRPAPVGDSAVRLVDSGRSGRLAGLKRFVLEQAAIPDLRAGWVPSAVLAGLRVIKSRGIDVIVSDSPSETAHLVGYLVARISGKPWVADFRDGWLFESLKPAVRREGLRRRVEARLERRVATRADAVVTVSEPISEHFRQQYPWLRGRVQTITNGYDADDWTDVVPKPRDPSKFLVVYTGSFGGSRGSQDPRPFLEALSRLPDEMRGQTRVELVGYLAPEERRECERLGLAGLINPAGSVSRPESLAYQLSADVLLLLVGGDVSVATSKLFEYLFARRPIFALSRTDGAAASIVRRAGAGYVVSPSDPGEVTRALQDMFDAWRAGRLGVAPTGIEQYDRRRLTGDLAAVLDEAIRRRKREQRHDG